MDKEAEMTFVMDVFFEFLAMLLGFIGLLCSFAGALVAIVGALTTYVDITEYVSVTVPSFINLTIGAVILVAGILLMSLSSVMRKRIARPR
jgi:uncharacterized membrane protein required for colicin V production